MNNLLDDLCAYLRKDYISKLKELDSVDKHEAIKFFKKVNAHDYSIFAWGDAHQYLTGHRHGSVFPEEARLKIIKCLENKERG